MLGPRAAEGVCRRREERPDDLPAVGARERCARAAGELRARSRSQRPGRFRWSYETPYEQLIVGDGAKLWIYDRDLNQVITHKQDVSLGASPAALLSGDNALDRNFDVVDAGASDGLEFVDARPRASESGVERVRIGFRDNLPRTMELRDTFGNVTTLTFESFERNVKLDPAQFVFVPPPGADVVGDK